jgi:hypothetical protein
MEVSAKGHEFFVDGAIHSLPPITNDSFTVTLPPP